jgi:transposase-like protein
MSPRKLSDADKQKIISLYKETEETTSTLATRFGVSSSTISRFLKSNLSEVEYEDLIQQKRLARTPHREQTAQLVELDKQLELSIEQPSTQQSEEESNDSNRWKRRRSSAPFQNEEIEETPKIEKSEQIKPIEEKIITTKIAKEIKPIVSVEPKTELSAAEAKELERIEAFTLGAMLGEDMADIDDDDDEDLEDDDFDDDEDWALEIKPNLVRTKTKNADVKVLPLSKAALPKTCYLVVDRLAELIVLPMKDFADLGSIPDEEIKQKTLPIFDNHRVARRFSNRSQRVIKVPDSQMLQKTSSHLQAKGITRLLLDGQIYSLISVS